MAAKQTNPIDTKKEIHTNPDPKIDEDFKGYPHGPAKDETITPATGDEKETADADQKDGEKIIIKPKERESLDEQDSDGSANAFDDK